MNHKIIILILIFSCTFFNSCSRRRHSESRDNESRNSSERVVSDVNDKRDSYREEKKIRKGTKVMMLKENGVYYIPINVNGIQLKFIIDTGASSVCISSAEAVVMYRQGNISQDDVIGKSKFSDATGRISEGTVINLRTIDIGGIVLHDIEATVIDNINAPLLLGQSALARFGKFSFNYKQGYIEFN